MMQGVFYCFHTTSLLKQRWDVNKKNGVARRVIASWGHAEYTALVMQPTRRWILALLAALPGLRAAAKVAPDAVCEASTPAPQHPFRYVALEDPEYIPPGRIQVVTNMGDGVLLVLGRMDIGSVFALRSGHRFTVVAFGSVWRTH